MAANKSNGYGRRSEHIFEGLMESAEVQRDSVAHACSCHRKSYRTLRAETSMWKAFPQPFLRSSHSSTDSRRDIISTMYSRQYFSSAAVSLLFNRFVRTSCLAMASVIFIAILSSRVYYENNRLSTGCILFLIGLQQTDRKPWLICYQVALVYLGAGLNKILDIDWRTGQFFENWMINVLDKKFYVSLASALPPMLLSRVLSWMTMISELSIGAGFLIRRFSPLAIWGGILFHTALLLLTDRTYGMFYYTMLASFLAFAEWPESPVLVLYDGDCGFCKKTKNLFARFDIEKMFNWRSFQTAENLTASLKKRSNGNCTSSPGKRSTPDSGAFKMMLLYNPLTYFAFAIIAAAPQPEPFRYKNWLIVALIIFFSPLFTPLGEAAYTLVAKKPQSHSREKIV